MVTARRGAERRRPGMARASGRVAHGAGRSTAGRPAGGRAVPCRAARRAAPVAPPAPDGAPRVVRPPGAARQLPPQDHAAIDADEASAARAHPHRRHRSPRRVLVVVVSMR